MFNAVTEESFLQVRFRNKEKTTGEIFEGKDMLDASETLNLASQARSIRQFRVWTKLVKSMQYTANEKLFMGSQTTDDMIFAKAVLWTLKVMDEKLENIGKLHNTKAKDKESKMKLLNTKKSK